MRIVDARANEDEFRRRALELSDGQPEGVAYADDARARALCVGVVGHTPPRGDEHDVVVRIAADDHGRDCHAEDELRRATESWKTSAEEDAPKHVVVEKL